jgi:hypothetical protein
LRRSNLGSERRDELAALAAFDEFESIWGKRVEMTRACRATASKTGPTLRAW